MARYSDSMNEKRNKLSIQNVIKIVFRLKYICLKQMNANRIIRRFIILDNREKK